MIVLPLLAPYQEPVPQTAPKPQVKQTDPLRVPIPPEKPAGFTEIENPTDRQNDPIRTAKLKNVWTFRRNNPRSTYLLQTAAKAGGRPALVDAAGRPVQQNLVFTVVNPSIGKVRVYATKLARGPFYTAWTALPKNSSGKFLQVSGTLLTAAEIRAVVAGIKLLATSRAPAKTIGGDPYEKDAGEDKTNDGSTVNGGGKTTGG